MGVQGILKEIGKGERVALAKLAVEHLERTQRPLRIAIDAAIWTFQSQAGQGGKNPALRTLYYRLLKILALPIHPLFVYDGKNKPLTKRGRTVTRWGSCLANETSKLLIQQFRFPHHVAPGEAEAECALLQRKGLVDMVMSQDGDAIMFGSNVTLRDWSKECTRGNKSPTHVNMLDLPRIKEMSGLDPDGMILVALLSGGDYDQDGIPGFGPGLACEIARAGFGEDLLELVRNKDEVGISEWRQRLQYELESNESGYFKRKHKTLEVPEDFPDRKVLGYYTNPAVSKDEDLKKIEKKWLKTWDSQIDILGLREYVGQTFDWLYKPGAWKFIRGMAPSLLAHKLRLNMAQEHVKSVEQIIERRQHFSNDGIPELRISAIPADIIGLDLDAEEDSPEHLARVAEEQGEGLDDGANAVEGERDASEEPAGSQSPKTKRKALPWRPTNPEKMWIPETVAKLGVPALLEEWEQIQRNKLSDPKKFAARKAKPAKPKTILATSKKIDQFFRTSKSAVAAPISMGNVSSSEPEKVMSSAGLKTPLRPKQANAPAERAGSSAKHATVWCSPPRNSEELISQSESGRALLEATLEPELPELPSSVTQRRWKAAPKVAKGSNSTQASPSKNSRSIESIFVTATKNAKKDLGMKNSAQDRLDDSKIPSDPSTGLETNLLPKHLYAAPRDSLPGSWRLLDIDEDVLPTKTKRSNRVSYLDMTKD